MNEWEQGRERSFRPNFREPARYYIISLVSWAFSFRYKTVQYTDALYELYQIKQVTHNYYHHLLSTDEYHRIALFWSMQREESVILVEMKFKNARHPTHMQMSILYSHLSMN